MSELILPPEVAAERKPAELKLNLGCGRVPLEGHINIDVMPGPGVDVVLDLDRAPTDPQDYEPQVMFLYGDLIEAINLHVGDDGSHPWVVTHVAGIHFLEHVRGHMVLMEALWRLVEPDATALFFTPHGATDDAFEDPTHVRPMFPNSYIYYGQPAYHRADYGFRGDWQLTNVRYEVFPEYINIPQPQLVAKITRERNVVAQMGVLLKAIKPCRDPLNPGTVDPAELEIVSVSGDG